MALASTIEAPSHRAAVTTLPCILLPSVIEITAI
jgi:hypothetical protein